MPYKWKNHKIPRFYGVDRKTNPLDVKDGYALDCQNVFQDLHGVISKTRGHSVLFDYDHPGFEIDEIGSATLYGKKYYFMFVNGAFIHKDVTTPSAQVQIGAAYTSGNSVWWAVLDNKVFFVDGDANSGLKFFDPSVSTSNVYTSSVYERSITAPTSVSVGPGCNFVFTVEKAYSTTVTSAESAKSNMLETTSTANITVPASYTTPSNTTVTPQVNDRIRIYSSASTQAASFKNVTKANAAPTANGVYEENPNNPGDWYFRITAPGPWIVSTLAISDDQPNLYTDLGVAINKSAINGLTGIITHYGRLVAWKNDTFYNSKFSNPHAWPDDSANNEAFVYQVSGGDGEKFQRFISFQESLYAFKKTHIYVFGGVGPDDTGGNAYAFRRIETNGIGCVAPKSVCVIGEDDGNMLVFLSRHGFYATNGTAPARIGEKIENELINLSEAQQASTVAFHHKREGMYVAFTGASTDRKGYILDTRKDNDLLTGWFKLRDIQVKSVFYDVDRYIFGAYNGFAGYELVAGSDQDYSFVRINQITSVDTAQDSISFGANHNITTGDACVLRTSGSAPTGLSAATGDVLRTSPTKTGAVDTVYYAIKVSDTSIKLASSYSDAQAGIAIDLTTAGAGASTIISLKPIDAFYKTNWINFGSTSYVKKLGRASVSFDATASLINLDVDIFYDWLDATADTYDLTLLTSDSWGALAWGAFAWGGKLQAVPKSMSLPRRKVRAIAFKFSNNVLNEDFNLQSLEIPFAAIRNRDNLQ